MQFNWRKNTSALLAGIMMISSISTTTFASSQPINEHSLKIATAALVTETANDEITESTANKIAQEIINGQYEYASSDIDEYSVATKGLSKGAKTVLKFIKNNWPKIEKVLKKYGVTATKGKATIGFINQLLDGVIAVDDGIDNVIYAVVDFVAPNLNPDTKKIIANAIRLISPV